MAGPFLLGRANDPCKRSVAPKATGLTGAWEQTSVEINGKLHNGPIGSVIVFSKGGWWKHSLNGSTIAEDTYTFDPSAMPATIDLHITKSPNSEWIGKTKLDIYEVKRDELLLCSAEERGKRPKKFTGEAGSHCRLAIYKRINRKK